MKNDWLGKVINRELCKKFKLNHTNKLYMHNPASLLENESQKLLWDFKIQTDHLISARRPHFIITNQKRELAELRTSCEGIEKGVDMKVTIITIAIGAFDTVSK